MPNPNESLRKKLRWDELSQLFEDWLLAEEEILAKSLELEWLENEQKLREAEILRLSAKLGEKAPPE